MYPLHDLLILSIQLPMLPIQQNYGICVLSHILKKNNEPILMRHSITRKLSVFRLFLIIHIFPLYVLTLG